MTQNRSFPTTCGIGCLEIKCPYKFKEGCISDIVNHEGSYLSKDDNIKLVITHAYYYPVQTKLLITNYDYCDLFMMLPDDSTCIRI